MSTAVCVLCLGADDGGYCVLGMITILVENCATRKHISTSTDNSTTELHKLECVYYTDGRTDGRMQPETPAVHYDTTMDAALMALIFFVKM